MTRPIPVNGVYRAEVKSVDTAKARVKVTIVHLGGNNVYTVRILLPIGAPAAVLGATTIAVSGGGGGTVALRELRAGDEVLVAFLEGDRDRPILLGRLA